MRLAILLLASLVLDWLRPATPIFERPRMKNPDAFIGAAMVAGGTTGLTMADVLDGVLLYGNVALVLGGLVLLGFRIVLAWRELKQRK